jgi:hypothetical protein
MSKTNSQVAHMWAQGVNNVANGSNFRCEQNTLYSYYTCIGFIEKGTAFLSADNMTTSTSKHLSYASRAIKGDYLFSPVFHYGNHYKPEVKDTVLAAVNSLIADYKSLDKALSRLPYLIENFQHKRENIVNIAKKHKVKIGKLPVITKTLKEKAADYAERAEQREKAKREKYEKALQAERTEKMPLFNAWLEKGEGSLPYCFRTHGNDLLTIQGDKVVTSNGAEAPLSHVKHAIRFYLSRRNNAGFTPYKTNGHSIPLGHFVLDSIDEQGNAVAGCHTFSADEIERFITHWQLA